VESVRCSSPVLVVLIIVVDVSSEEESRTEDTCRIQVRESDSLIRYSGGLWKWLSWPSMHVACCTVDCDNSTSRVL